MNIPQNNKLTMYELVLEIVNANAGIWKNTTVVSEAVSELAAVVPQIRKAGAIKATSVKGATQAKADKKMEMAKRAGKLSGLTSAYAVKNKNVTLQAALDYSYSELYQAKDNLAIDRCTAIHDQVKTVLTELKPYGIVAADLEALLAAITSFRALIGQKGQQQSGQKATTQSLENLFKQADALLKTQLDKLMLRYKDSHREFYDAYLASRLIRNMGGSRKPAPAKAA